MHENAPLFVVPLDANTRELFEDPAKFRKLLRYEEAPFNLAFEKDDRKDDRWRLNSMTLFWLRTFAVTAGYRFEAFTGRNGDLRPVRYVRGAEEFREQADPSVARQ